MTPKRKKSQPIIDKKTFSEIERLNKNLIEVEQRIKAINGASISLKVELGGCETLKQLNLLLAPVGSQVFKSHKAPTVNDFQRK